MAEISRELGLKQNTVSTVSKGYGRSKRVQYAIAVKLGKRPEQIWPERYATKKDNI
jgi:lambda repressor-like predicted transcriptional regulator